MEKRTSLAIFWLLNNWFTDWHRQTSTVQQGLNCSFFHCLFVTYWLRSQRVFSMEAEIVTFQNMSNLLLLYNLLIIRFAGWQGAGSENGERADEGRDRRGLHRGAREGPQQQEQEAHAQRPHRPEEANHLRGQEKVKLSAIIPLFLAWTRVELSIKRNKKWIAAICPSWYIKVNLWELFLYYSTFPNEFILQCSPLIKTL